MLPIFLVRVLNFLFLFQWFSMSYLLVCLMFVLFLFYIFVCLFLLFLFFVSRSVLFLIFLIFINKEFVFFIFYFYFLFFICSLYNQFSLKIKNKDDASYFTSFDIIPSLVCQSFLFIFLGMVSKSSVVLFVLWCHY